MKTPCKKHHLEILALAAVFGGGLSGWAVATPVSATGPTHATSTTSTTLSAEQRVRDNLRVLMAELVADGAFGKQSPNEIAMTIDMPAQRINNLGLVVGSAKPRGVEVLAVTPGSNAEAMGLHAGDAVLTFNGTALGEGDAAIARLRSDVNRLPDGGAIALQIDRDGEIQSLAGHLSSVEVPAMRLQVGNPVQPSTASAAAESTTGDCARISTFDVAPRQQNLHGAIVTTIDGGLPGPHDANSYRVTPGQHVLKVTERIESRYLTFNDRLRNSSDRYKTLEIDTPVNTTTMIAARLIPGKSGEWQNGAYWEPVAWKQIAEPCR